MPKRSSDNYIQLKKKITNPELIKIIKTLKVEWLLSEQDVCYRLMIDSAQREVQKRKENAHA